MSTLCFTLAYRERMPCYYAHACARVECVECHCPLLSIYSVVEFLRRGAKAYAVDKYCYKAEVLTSKFSPG